VQAASHAASQITPFLARILGRSPRTIPTSRLAFYHHPVLYGPVYSSDIVHRVS